METTLFQVATWWAIGAIGGALEWTNHRILAGFCVVMVLIGFTFTALTGRYDPAAHFYAARSGNDYHREGSVCLKNVHDPIPFRSESDAQDHGFGPCDRCVLHIYEIAARSHDPGESDQ